LLSLWLSSLAGTAFAAPSFVFLKGFQDPSNFESRFNSCISQFQAAGGLSAAILNRLANSEVVIYYQKGGAALDPPGADPLGKPLYLAWDSNLTGLYPDKAPKNSCAGLLHELQHAARTVVGSECTGALGDNEAAYQFDEKIGSRAENAWLNRLGLKQRTTYNFYEKTLTLDRWTRWPPSAANPVPAAPKCIRSCPAPNSAMSVADAPQAACTRCVRFHQPGCIDFHGGIYSGGDHRRVANGSLRIVIGAVGYCQGRNPCEFREQVTAPHLDTAFPKGVTVTAIATPGKDSRFYRWGPGACKGKGSTCSFTATKPSCISAQFLLTTPTAPPQSLPTVPCQEDP